MNFSQAFSAIRGAGMTREPPSHRDGMQRTVDLSKFIAQLIYIQTTLRIGQPVYSSLQGIAHHF